MAVRTQYLWGRIFSQNGALDRPRAVQKSNSVRTRSADGKLTATEKKNFSHAPCSQEGDYVVLSTYQRIRRAHLSRPKLNVP